MQMPKCGGTSVSEALYATVPLHHKIGILNSPPIRRALALASLGQDEALSYHDEGPQAAAVAAFREQLALMHLAHDCLLGNGAFPAF